MAFFRIAKMTKLQPRDRDKLGLINKRRLLLKSLSKCEVDFLIMVKRYSLVQLFNLGPLIRVIA